MQACFGTLCATTANFSMAKDHKKPALKPSDFFPLIEHEEEPEEMTAEETLKYLAAVFQANPAN